MRHRWTKLSLLAAGALVVPASLGVMALPGAASATVPAGSASCSGILLKVVGTKATLTLKPCTDTANTGGSGTILATTLIGKGAQTVKITWANGGTTTTSLTVTKGETDADLAGKSCAVGDTEYEAKGTVKSDTGKAKSIKVGGKVSGEICAKGAAISLEPGTTFIV